MNNRKYIVATLLAISFLISITLRGLIETALLQADNLGDPILFGLFKSTTVGAVIFFAACFFVLNRTSKVVQFTDESWTELRSVTWPDREETVRSTVVVIGVTLFIAFMLGLYDFVWAKVASETLFGKEEIEEEG
ncbi:MAG: preprotein translocase subunit SecE [Myxococcota bacterium]|nr:preprotein translocase subunit SecE [Myxococcota bacterium]